LLLNEETCHETAEKLELLAPDISLSAVTDQLETDGVAAFEKSYEELLATLTAKMPTLK
jgi:transaldolase